MGMWKFEIIDIQPTRPPHPESTGSWYHYTIANHITQISGTRRGTRTEVTAFVNTSLQRLNARHRVAQFTKS